VVSRFALPWKATSTTVDHTMKASPFLLGLVSAAVACSTEARPKDTSSAMLATCSALPGPDAAQDSIDDATVDDELGTCSACGDCGGDVFENDDQDDDVAAASTGAQSRATELHAARIHTLVQPSLGWTTRFHRTAHGWSVIFPPFADASLEHYLGDLERACSAIAHEDPKNLQRCVLLKFPIASTGFYPYTSVWQKTRCECNPNVNAIHPDE
jgi:hypothetical protein